MLTLPALPVIVITGPTAVGKTELALRVAAALPTGAEIVSADSMQVYRGLDIGTAKPAPAERAAFPHHLIDIVDPVEPFNVADWVALARPLLADVRRRGRVPIVSGGTPLYLEALLGRFALAAGAGPDPETRARLGRLADRYGLAHLWGQLAAVDPVAAARIHPADRKRTVRGLEVYLGTGRPLSQLERRAGLEKPRVPEPVLFFGLWRPREELAARIEARVQTMLDAGLVEEVRGLLAGGLPADLPAMQGVGYKEVAEYLGGRVSLEEAASLIARNTRRLAKRQMTWLRADPRIRWLRGGINIPASVELITTSAGGQT